MEVVLATIHGTSETEVKEANLIYLKQEEICYQ